MDRSKVTGKADTAVIKSSTHPELSGRSRFSTRIENGNPNDLSNYEDYEQFRKLRNPDLCENEVSPNQPPGAGNSGAPRLNLMVNFVPGYL